MVPSAAVAPAPTSPLGAFDVSFDAFAGTSAFACFFFLLLDSAGNVGFKVAVEDMVSVDCRCELRGLK